MANRLLVLAPGSARWACLGGALLALALSLGAEPTAPLPSGAFVERVTCAHDAAQSYALYLPSAYRADRRWPVVYCFDPAGRGSRPVQLLQSAAERFGYIIVGSHNSRNGPWALAGAAAAAMVRDVEHRFAVDPRRRYGCGMSGGARAACIAAGDHGFAGVLGCAAGFATGAVPPEVPFAFFGAVGDEDFNYTEMQDAAAELTARKLPHRLAVFAGPHGWPPPDVVAEALAWFELQAMRAGLRPRDDALVTGWLRERRQAAAALTSPGEAFLAYQQIAADFAGLADTADAARAAAALRDTKPVRKHLAAATKLRQQEDAWLAELHNALEFARNPPERDVAAEMFGQLPALGETSMGGDAAEPSGGTDFGARRYSPALELRSPAATDRFAGVRRLAAELQRKRRDNLAARRVLAHAYSLQERARVAYEEHSDVATAHVYFEAVTILLPRAPEPYFNWARLCALDNNKARARELLREASARGFNDAARRTALEQMLEP